jgi:hypothetical protein
MEAQTEAIYSRDEQIAIANTIRQQMGISNFGASGLGLYGSMALDGGWTFRFKGSTKANKVVIMLRNDLYTMTFWRISPTGKVPNKVTSSHDGIYCDQLQEIFERVTGLVTGPQKVRFG